MSITILSISLDWVGATAAAFEWNPNSRELTRLTHNLPPKDTREAIKASTGATVATLIGDYAREVQSIFADRRINAVAISTPGTIEVASGVVMKSTRIGILERFDFRGFLRDRYGVSATLVNDAEAAARGEVRYGAGRSKGLRPLDTLDKFGDFAYVLISEGIGCAIFINGQKYLGAGAAGHIGRMTIDPAGPLSERFSSRGPLESYASREVISRQIVAEFRREQDRASVVPEQHLRFDRILSAIRDSGQIPVSDIAEAVASGHPIAIATIDEAAHYIGIAVGGLITIMNPPTLILGGDMIQNIPHLFKKTAEAAERFTWSIAWNKTNLLLGELAEPQLWGAAHLAGEEAFF